MLKCIEHDTCFFMIMCINDAALETQSNFKQFHFLAIRDSSASRHRTAKAKPAAHSWMRNLSGESVQGVLTRIFWNISRVLRGTMINQLLKYLFPWAVSPFSSDHKKHHKNHFNYWVCWEEWKPAWKVAIPGLARMLWSLSWSWAT